ncbi:hypothetical protein NXC24_CH01095 [Rhizobium sp. NXC24]|nr:hypothetical protein NXC24_CH01095 [Rhizobium sp. NXC24]
MFKACRAKVCSGFAITTCAKSGPKAQGADLKDRDALRGIGLGQSQRRDAMKAKLTEEHAFCSPASYREAITLIDDNERIFSSCQPD